MRTKQTFSEVFPVIEPDQVELDEAQAAFEIVNGEFSTIDGNLQKLRTELGKITNAQPEASEELPDPGAAFVNGLLNQSAMEAAEAAEKAYRAEQKRRDVALLADEKNKSIIAAIADAINQLEETRSGISWRFDVASVRVGKAKAKFLYRDVIRPTAKQMLLAMQALQRLEAENHGCGCSMSLRKFRLTNPINNEWIDLSTVLEDE